MNVANLLARLNPSSCSYSDGSGSPEFTPLDLAAGIGAIRNSFGRELLCALWWPDGAIQSPQLFDKKLRDLQLREWILRAEQLQIAQLSLHCAEDDHIAPVWQLRQQLQDATAAMWPKFGEKSRYRAIRNAVLNEMRAPGKCGKCQGHGTIRLVARIDECQACCGSGLQPASDRGRAKAIGVDHKSFQRWKDPYCWLLNECTRHEHLAAMALLRQLEMGG